MPGVSRWRHSPWSCLPGDAPAILGCPNLEIPVSGDQRWNGYCNEVFSTKWNSTMRRHIKNHSDICLVCGSDFCKSWHTITTLLTILMECLTSVTHAGSVLRIRMINPLIVHPAQWNFGQNDDCRGILAYTTPIICTLIHATEKCKHRASLYNHKESKH